MAEELDWLHHCKELREEAKHYENLAQRELNRRLRAVNAARKHLRSIGTLKYIISIQSPKEAEKEFVRQYVLNATHAGCTGNTVELGRLAWKKLQEIIE